MDGDTVMLPSSHSATLCHHLPNTFDNLVPSRIIDDLGANLDLFRFMVEFYLRQLARGDVRVHLAHVAQALAIGCSGDPVRSFLVEGLRAAVIEDFI